MLIFCASTQNIDPYSLTIDVISKALTVSVAFGGKSLSWEINSYKIFTSIKNIRLSLHYKSRECTGHIKQYLGLMLCRSCENSPQI